MNAVNDILDCLDMMILIIPGLKLNANILDRNIYLYLTSVDEINKKVNEGIPFREAYLQTAMDIEKGKFRSGKRAKHTHCGSIDNLSNNRIKEKLEQIKERSDYKKYTDFRVRFIKKTIKDHGIQK